MTKMPEFDFKKLKFEFDLSQADYQIDTLQNELLQMYLRADSRFRRAFSKNFTPHLLQFIKDKAKLREPVSLSVIGNVRCEPKGSKVLMANGEWKNIEEILIGDKVISPQENGTNIFAKVIGISSHLSDERIEIYEKNRQKIKLYSCSKKHELPLLHKQKNGKWIIKNYEAEELLKYCSKGFNCRKLGFFSFPILKFENRKNCKIEPYSLGFYLGNGHYTQSVGITTQNKEIITKISKHYKFMNINSKKDNLSKTYLFSKNSKFAKLLRGYNLKEKKANMKFIPREALVSDINYRKKLLAGLIDSDGTLSKSTSYSITTKSKQLAKDIVSLIHSLGGRTYLSKISKTIKSINFEGNYFKIGFYLGNLIYKIPILEENKKRNKEKGFIYLEPNRIAIKIKKRRKREIMYGFELDSPSKWYITDNFIITHNSGKSYSSITLASINMMCYGKYFTIDNICANAYEFLEKLKSMPMEKSKNNCFLIDEEKQAVYGIGSVARKIKLLDVANIVAINNISTIFLNPVKWANSDANYGLKAFGRCFKTKTCRFMLYNLQEKGKGGELPLGCVYLPIFTAFLPKDYADILEKQYLEKKMNWVGKELSEHDVLSEIKRKSAENFCRDKKFLELKSKKYRRTYIQQKLGSEWVQKEIDEVENIATLIQLGVL